MGYTVSRIKCKKKPGRQQRYRWEAKVRLNWCKETKRYLTTETKSRPTEASAIEWAQETEEKLLGNKQIRDALRTDATMRQLIQAYIKQGDWKSTSTVNRYKSYLKYPIATKRCLTVTRQDGLDLEQALIDRGLAETTVAKEMNGWKAMINYGVEHRYFEFNPWRNLEYVTPHKNRTRLPTEAEIEAFNRASGYSSHTDAPRNVTEAAVCAWMISCITGMRQNEVVSARATWLCIAPESVMMLPPEVTKNGQGRVVPLEPAAMAHINRLVPDPDNGRYFQWSARTISEEWAKLRDTLGIGGRDEPGGMVYHDSKHYAVTNLMSRLQPHLVMAMVGHKSARMLIEYSQPEVEHIAKRLHDTAA